MKLASGKYSDLVWQNIPKELFNDILSKFYVEVRKQDGKPYSKQAYVCLRAGLQRYLCDGPWFKPYEESKAIKIQPRFFKEIIAFLKLLHRC